MIQTETKTRQFTLLQLFNIVDGRMVTTMNDIYDILGWISGDPSITTIGLTRVMDNIKANKPEWYNTVHVQIVQLKEDLNTNDWKVLSEYIKNGYNPAYDIPQEYLED